MNTLLLRRCARRAAPGALRQGGQSLMEYAVVCGALAFALFVPIQDVGSPDKARTTVQIVLDGFKTAYRNICYSISLPG